jgi:4-carboxymuconolactone decarboxylase
MGRLRQLDPAELTSQQRGLYDRIAAKRGAVRGPFNAWLYSPELCDRVESLGKYLRYDSAIPMLLREVVVLAVARHFTSQYMWQAHARIAVKEGVSQAVVDAIGKRQLPLFPAPEQKVVFDYAAELLRDHEVSDASWAAAVKLLGEVGTVELTAFIGNFSMVAMALNAFKVDLPKGVEPQLAG